MICYKDMTYCSFYKECAVECHRALTPEIRKEAVDFGLLICMFMEKPDCFKQAKNSHGNVAKGVKR